MGRSRAAAAARGAASVVAVVVFEYGRRERHRRQLGIVCGARSRGAGAVRPVATAVAVSAGEARGQTHPIFATVDAAGAAAGAVDWHAGVVPPRGVVRAGARAGAASVRQLGGICVPLLPGAADAVEGAGHFGRVQFIGAAHVAERDGDDPAAEARGAGSAAEQSALRGLRGRGQEPGGRADGQPTGAAVGGGACAFRRCQRQQLVSGTDEQGVSGDGDGQAARGGGGVACIRIDGKTGAAERPTLVQRFQSEPQCQAALLGITAAGAGITLTAASVVVFAEIYWNPGVLRQAEDRAHRIGQRDSVTVRYLLLPNSLDERMWRAVNAKLGVVSTSLDGSDARDARGMATAAVGVTAGDGSNGANRTLDEYFGQRRRESPAPSTGMREGEGGSPESAASEGDADRARLQLRKIGSLAEHPLPRSTFLTPPDTPATGLVSPNGGVWRASRLPAKRRRTGRHVRKALNQRRTADKRRQTCIWSSSICNIRPISRCRKALLSPYALALSNSLCADLLDVLRRRPGSTRLVCFAPEIRARTLSVARWSPLRVVPHAAERFVVLNYDSALFS
eukprot:ctg_1892.g713